MSEKRFVEDYSYLVNYDKYCILDKVRHKYLYLDEVIDLLNEQEEEIKVLQNNCEIMNRRISELYMSIHSSDELDNEKLEALKDAETEIKLLNSYLVENGLAEDFIRWKIK